MAELYRHVTVDAGLPVTVHLNVAVMPSVNDVDEFIELAVSSTWGSMTNNRLKLKCYK